MVLVLIVGSVASGYWLHLANGGLEDRVQESVVCSFTTSGDLVSGRGT